MKRSRSLMTLAPTLLCLFVMTGCKKTATTPAASLQSKIIGKWTMVAAIGDYTVYGDNRKDTTFFTSADYFEFKPDSTISIFETGVAYNGRWQIDHDRLYITGTNYMDYSSGFDLPILDQHNLQIHNTDTNSISTLDQKLNLTR